MATIVTVNGYSPYCGLSQSKLQSYITEYRSYKEKRDAAQAKLNTLKNTPVDYTSIDKQIAQAHAEVEAKRKALSDYSKAHPNPTNAQKSQIETLKAELASAEIKESNLIKNKGYMAEYRNQQILKVSSEVNSYQKKMDEIAATLKKYGVTIY